MNSQQYTQPEFQPSSGHIKYNRWMGHNFEVMGEVIGERKVTLRRYNAVVTEYLVKPNEGFTNLSKHVVDEGDIIELKQCPACNGTGIISIRNGDDDQPCPICGDVDDSEVF